MDPYFMLSIYMSEYFRPTGEPAPIWWATSRWQNEEYDAVVRQMNTLSADDPETMELFKQAMDIWVRELPDVYVAQLIIRYPMSKHYWTGWPTEADAVRIPALVAAGVPQDYSETRAHIVGGELGTGRTRGQNAAAQGARRAPCARRFVGAVAD